jgi:2-methylcitrate dehydratase PrpD
MAEETATLAAYVADLRFDDIPTEVRERAKVLTLDFLGSAIRARRDAESTPSLIKMLEALALDGTGESTVFGDTKTWTPAVAALLNGALGHSLDFDDTHADSSLHPSAPVVPAAFAIGELVGASGRDVLTAIVAGYEVCCRLGNAPAVSIPPPLRAPMVQRPPRPSCLASRKTRSSRHSGFPAARPRARCNSWSMAPGTSAIRSAPPR